MDFIPGETVDAVSALTKRTLALQEIADFPDNDSWRPPWKSLAQAGLLANTVPTALGGDGLGIVEALALADGAGAAGLVLPVVETVLCGALVLAEHGNEALQREVLSPIATGDELLAAAIHEPSDPYPARPRTTVVEDGGDLVLSGTKTSVGFASEATRLLVTATLADGEPAIVMTSSDAAVPTPNSAGFPEYTVRFADVRVPVSAVLARGRDALNALHRNAILGACAIADGALREALRLTTEHVRTREQFGRPLATNQAVAGQIADVYIASRTVHLATMAAADRLSSSDVRTAAYWVARSALSALRTCHHLHGGLGVDASYPLHRYYSVVKDMVRTLGGEQWCLEQLAASQKG
jgi:hypothetical protein